MVTVTILNITKLSEDFLYDRLDALYDLGSVDSDEYILIDSELDRRNAVLIESERREKEAELARQVEMERLIKEYESIRDSNGSRVTMRAMVEEFGNEFQGNYSIDDRLRVLSSCFNPRNPNQQNVWQCSSIDDANKKVFYLIYWRVYDRYFREPESVSLARLTAAITTILKGE